MRSGSNGAVTTFGEVVERRVERVSNDLADEFDWWVGVDHLDGDCLRIRRMAENSEGGRPPTFLHAFRSGDVLFPTRRPALRKAALAATRGLTGEKVLVLRVRDDRLLHPRFLPHLVFSGRVRNWAIKRAVGSVTPHFRWGDLAACPIWLPPLNDQASLSDALDRFHEALEATRDLVTAARRQEARAFEGLVGDAGSYRVDELCLEPPRNGTSPRCNAEGRGYPTLSVGCLYTGVVNTRDNLKYAELEDETYAKFRLHEGDVLVVRGNGNRELCGRAGMVVENETGCFFPDLLIRLRFDPEIVLPEYATIAWNSLPVHRELLGRAKSTNGIFKINGKDVREHQLPAPDLPSQHEIVRHFRAVRDAGDSAHRRFQQTFRFLATFMWEHFDQHQEVNPG